MMGNRGVSQRCKRPRNQDRGRYKNDEDLEKCPSCMTDKAARIARPNPKRDAYVKPY